VAKPLRGHFMMFLFSEIAGFVWKFCILFPDLFRLAAEDSPTYQDHAAVPGFQGGSGPKSKGEIYFLIAVNGWAVSVRSKLLQDLPFDISRLAISSPDGTAKASNGWGRFTAPGISINCLSMQRYTHISNRYKGPDYFISQYIIKVEMFSEFVEFVEVELATFCRDRVCRSKLRPVEQQSLPVEAKAKDRPVKVEVEELRAEVREWEVVNSVILRAVQKFPETLKQVLAAVAALRRRAPCPA
jgi:hypothetical protein